MSGWETGVRGTGGCGVKEKKGGRVVREDWKSGQGGKGEVGWAGSEGMQGRGKERVKSAWSTFSPHILSALCCIQCVGRDAAVRTSLYSHSFTFRSTHKQ